MNFLHIIMQAMQVYHHPPGPASRNFTFFSSQNLAGKPDDRAGTQTQASTLHSCSPATRRKMLRGMLRLGGMDKRLGGGGRGTSPTARGAPTLPT